VALVQPHLAQDAAEQRPGGADERPPAHVLQVAGLLTHEHCARGDPAFAEDDLGGVAPEVAAPAALGRPTGFGERESVGASIRPSWRHAFGVAARRARETSLVGRRARGTAGGLWDDQRIRCGSGGSGIRTHGASGLNVFKTPSHGLSMWFAPGARQHARHRPLPSGYADVRREEPMRSTRC